MVKHNNLLLSWLKAVAIVLLCMAFSSSSPVVAFSHPPSSLSSKQRQQKRTTADRVVVVVAVVVPDGIAASEAPSQSSFTIARSSNSSTTIAAAATTTTTTTTTPLILGTESSRREQEVDLPQHHQEEEEEQGEEVLSQQQENEPSTFSKVSRRIRVFSLAGTLFLSYKAAQFRETAMRRRLNGLSDGDDDNLDHPEIVELWDRTHQKNAKRLLEAIEQLQGFWIKVGQYLSSRADIMPRQYLQTLTSLQDGVPRKPFADVQRTLSEQLSPDDLLLFRTIDPDPLSTASLAQVHRATLVDGREVVIKAQHRGVASLMIQDMVNLRTILQLLSKFEPDFDYNPVVDEYTKEVRKELDFRTEAENMKEVKALLEGRHIRVVVPSVVPELVTEKVLVMDYCEGYPIRDIESLDMYHVDRTLLLERVCTSWAAQMHIGGTFNADPHPGNILVSTNQEDGDTAVPILLDFGLTKRFSPDTKIAFSRLVHSSYETDIDGLLQSFDEMGLKLNRYDPFQDMQAMQASFADPAPQSEAAEANKQRASEFKEREEAMREKQGLEKNQKLRNPVDAWPSELIFFSRVGAMLRGLCSRLEVRYPYLACMADAASETLRESIPKHEHAQGTVYNSPNGVYDSELQGKLQDLARELIDADHAIGMQVCVIHKGETVANVAAGTLGTVNPRPVTPSSLFNVFSVSKAVLATGVLRMLQEKEISVDDTIAKYWSKFGEFSDKKDVTIRHALSHQSGLATAFPSNGSIEKLVDWESMKDFVAGEDAIPSHKPGEETQYHYLTFAWLLGGLIEEVTGQPYEKYLMEQLIGPLGLENELHMGGVPDEVPREELTVLTARTLVDIADTNETKEDDRNQKHQAGHSTATAVRPRPAKLQGQGREQIMNPSVFNMQKVRAAKIPSANGHASARALAKLMDSVTTKDNAFLSSAILAQAGTPQQSLNPRRSTGAMLDNSMASFGLGFQVHEFKKLDTGAAFYSLGHSGFGGSIVISIPEFELTIAFTTNQLKLNSVARNRVLRAVLNEFGLDPPTSLIAS